MEDQFGGRTDDDLFFDDDFEPVDGVTTIVPNDIPVEISSYYITASEYMPHPADIESALAPLAAAAAAGKRKGRRRRKSKSPKPPPPPRGGLAQSRFADKPAESPSQNQREHHSGPQSQQSSSPARSQDQTRGGQIANVVAPNGPTPRNKRNNARNQGKLSTNVVDARSQSGTNPRQKLTEEELTAKMEKMKLLSIEKTRKFEKAEQDEKQHAEAYARGMEEAQRRRANIKEQQRKNDEERRRLENERNKNRERKMKAMNMKQGGWDDGKATPSEEDSRRPARGANGGVRGSTRAGLRGSLFARDSSEGEQTAVSNRTDTEKSLDEQPRRGGRGGRGRGNRGDGRGGRGRRGGRGGRSDTSGNGRGPPEATLSNTENFPSLKAQPEAQKVPVEAPPKPAELAPLPRFAPAIGKWDDEMEFLDEMNSGTAAKN